MGNTRSKIEYDFQDLTNDFHKFEILQNNLRDQLYRENGQSEERILIDVDKELLERLMIRSKHHIFTHSKNEPKAMYIWLRAFMHYVHRFHPELNLFIDPLGHLMDAMRDASNGNTPSLFRSAMIKGRPLATMKQTRFKVFAVIASDELLAHKAVPNRTEADATVVRRLRTAATRLDIAIKVGSIKAWRRSISSGNTQRPMSPIAKEHKSEARYIRALRKEYGSKTSELYFQLAEHLFFERVSGIKKRRMFPI
ncbi:MAG: hypothetical protein JSR78_04075 [Proteobacteria bacterium]|nr:hypothetical protein [Pseudomonadota bacterium]